MQVLQSNEDFCCVVGDPVSAFVLFLLVSEVQVMLVSQHPEQILPWQVLKDKVDEMLINESFVELHNKVWRNLF